MTEAIATGNQPTGQKKREREKESNACSGVKLAVRFRLLLGT